jgi:ribokinase
MADGGLLVAGALHLDVIVTAPRLPQPDETVTGAAVAYAMGGKGGNQAVAAARMGARVEMAGAVGRDAFARDLLAALDAAGVGRAQVRRVPGASGMSAAIVQADGSYGAVIVPAANLAIDAARIRLPRGTSHLLLQNEIPEAANLALAARAARAGIAVLLNAAPARSLPEPLLRAAAVLVVNRVEAAQLAGIDDPAEAARRLAAGGARQVIVTLGAAGLVAAGAETFAAAAPRVAAVSAHGAGDAFVGALAADLARGVPLAAACRFAQAAAALHVATAPQARAGIGRDAAEALARPVAGADSGAESAPETGPVSGANSAPEFAARPARSRDHSR